MIDVDIPNLVIVVWIIVAFFGDCFIDKRGLDNPWVGWIIMFFAFPMIGFIMMMLGFIGLVILSPITKYCGVEWVISSGLKF